MNDKNQTTTELTNIYITEVNKERCSRPLKESGKFVFNVALILSQSPSDLWKIEFYSYILSLTDYFHNNIVFLGNILFLQNTTFLGLANHHVGNLVKACKHANKQINENLDELKNQRLKENDVYDASLRRLEQTIEEKFKDFQSP